MTLSAAELGRCEPRGSRRPVSESCWDILLIDPLAEDKYHLIDDDLFLARCLEPLARRFLVATSSTSAANIQNATEFPTYSTHKGFPSRQFIRLQLLRNVLAVSSRPFTDVIFQSFEEVSTLVFMLLNPSKRVHLIVTNNLRRDRIDRHPYLGRLFLRAVLKRAASVIVHCQYEVSRIRELVPEIDRGKVFVKPFHHISQPRDLLGPNEKTNNVLFLGPDQPHKSLRPVLQLLNADHGRQFGYVFSSMASDRAADLAMRLGERANTTVHFGYVEPTDYYRRFSEARVVVLTHDSDFEGALSGVFCDALASGTPVVAKRMAPHDEFFERFGPMGFLVDYDDPGWYNPLLDGTLDQRYGEFQRNMAACRAACSSDAIREVLQASLSRSASRETSD